MIRQLDIILVGQGLAGSLLALTLAERGCKFIVIDPGASGTASSISAGIVNPVSGPRLVLSQDFQLLYGIARNRYRSIRARFGKPVFTALNQLRLFSSSEQAALWQTRLQSAGYAEMGAGITSTAPPEVTASAPFGSCWLGSSGFVDTAALLNTTRNWLADGGMLHADTFYHEDLLRKEGQVLYRGIRARHVIFCEGAQASENPWFPDLPMQPSCGELLTVKLPLDLDVLLHWGHWLLPLSPGIYRLGATNDWQLQRKSPLAAAKHLLLDSLQRILPGIKAVKVVDHVRGLRPSSRDRNPIIGHCPGFPQLLMFNGFGGKGALTIPAAAETLCSYLLDGKPLPEELDINRFRD